MSLVAELIPPNADLPDDLEADLGWAVGLKHVIGGHYFEILLTERNGTTQINRLRALTGWTAPLERPAAGV